MSPRPKHLTASASAWHVRAPFPDEAEQVLRILCAAFRLRVDAARPIFAGDPFYDLSHKRILVSASAGPVACLTIAPARIRVGAAWIPFGGIAGVATLPEHQRQGFAGELLQGAVRALAGELGYPLSGLFTDLPDYYRRFGWEYATRHCTAASTLVVLPKYAGGDDVRVTPLHDLPAQAQVEFLHAAALAERPTGAFERDDRRWMVIRRFLPGYRIALYQRDGPATGYVIFEETQETVRVHELYGQDRGAERALIGFLAGRAGRRLEWSAPLPEISRLWTHELAATEPSSFTVRADMMVRVADVAAALCAAHAANFAPILAAARTTLTVTVDDDSICPKNRHPLRITPDGIENGAHDDPRRITLGVAAFGQLFLGYHAASTLKALGALKASNAEALAAADLLFPSRDPYVAAPDRF